MKVCLDVYTHGIFCCPMIKLCEIDLLCQLFLKEISQLKFGNHFILKETGNIRGQRRIFNVKLYDLIYLYEGKMVINEVQLTKFDFQVVLKLYNFAMQKHFCVVVFPQNMGKKCNFDYEHQTLKVEGVLNTVNRVLVVDKLYKPD